MEDGDFLDANSPRIRSPGVYEFSYSG